MKNSDYQTKIIGDSLYHNLKIQALVTLPEARFEQGKFVNILFSFLYHSTTMGTTIVTQFEKKFPHRFQKHLISIIISITL